MHTPPILVLLLLTACPARRPPEAPAELATPRLPAPQADVYALVHGTPTDGVVSRLAGGRPWEESLSGAAGALAMQDASERDLSLWAARWSALRAGYAYPVLDVFSEEVDEGRPALGLPAALEHRVPATADLGLARARLGPRDLYVALVGTSPLDLAPIPRRIEIGDKLEVALKEAVYPASLSVEVASPSGRLLSRPLIGPTEVQLSEQGEWWFEIWSPTQLLAAFPVYAGIEPADDVPFQALPQDLRREANPEKVLVALLGEARALFSWPALQRDPILDASARIAARDGFDATAPRAESSACRESLRCRAESAEGALACMRSWFVEARSRAAFLNPACTLVGLATGHDERGSWIAVELGSP
jgi:hypothetical protein